MVVLLRIGARDRSVFLHPVAEIIGLLALVSGGFYVNARNSIAEAQRQDEQAKLAAGEKYAKSLRDRRDT